MNPFLKNAIQQQDIEMLSDIWLTTEESAFVITSYVKHYIYKSVPI